MNLGRPAASHNIHESKHLIVRYAVQKLPTCESKDCSWFMRNIGSKMTDATDTQLTVMYDIPNPFRWIARQSPEWIKKA
jgi:hypothetical protein